MLFEIGISYTNTVFITKKSYIYYIHVFYGVE